MTCNVGILKVGILPRFNFALSVVSRFLLKCKIVKSHSQIIKY